MSSGDELRVPLAGKEPILETRGLIDCILHLQERLLLDADISRSGSDVDISGDREFV